MATIREETHESRVLQRLFEITQDILQAQGLGPALESIARGLAELYGWRYVTIVASDSPEGDFFRRVLVGFSDEIVHTRLGERIPRDMMVSLLLPEFEIIPRCFYIPAEREQVWAYNIYTGDVPIDRIREKPGVWHDHDSLTLVLADRNDDMIGYISVDGPLDDRVPSVEALQQMQLFVNLVGLALGNARGQAVLEQTSRAQSEFFAVVAHEVRSPLAAIRGATSLLEQHFDTLGEDRRAELLSVMINSSSRLSAIFEDFLLLSRMDAGKLTLKFEAVDPIAVVEESVSRMQGQHPEHHFRTVYLEGLPAVSADEGRVVQILTNILSNAAKYSTPGSTIYVEIKPQQDNHIQFAVKNEGAGVPENERDKLFTRFGRIGRENGDASIGLGLYICAELVAMMGGNIGYDSEPHKVTTFWFTLPKAA